jgi:archaemetzincin
MTGLALASLGMPAGELLERLRVELSRVLRFRVERIPTIPEPEHAYDAARGQWSSTEMLKALLPLARPKPERLLGVTERDLFVPVLSFVYGQAQLDGQVAVVSLARLRPEFHGLPADRELAARRALKEAVHEVGHTFGLVHCPDRRCPMSLSVNLEDLDLKAHDPCASCSALLEGSFDMRRLRSPASEGPGGGR